MRIKFPGSQDHPAKRKNWNHKATPAIEDLNLFSPILGKDITDALERTLSFIEAQSPLCEGHPGFDKATCVMKSFHAGGARV